MNNGIAFGPDGKLYLAQGSISGYGAPDQNWGFRAETPAVGLDPRGRRRQRHPLRRRRLGQRRTPTPATTRAAANARGEGLRRGHPQPLRPRVALERLAVRAGQRVGRRQHAGRPRRQPAGPQRPARPVATSSPRSTQGKYYGHPNPRAGPLRAQRRQPDGRRRPVRDAAVPRGRQRPTRPTSSRSSTWACTARPTASTSTRSTSSAATLRGKLLIAEYSNGDDIVAVNPTDTSDKFQIATGAVQPARREGRPGQRQRLRRRVRQRPRRRRRPHHAAQAGARTRSARRSPGSTSSRKASPVPAGYSKDYGQAYDGRPGLRLGHARQHHHADRPVGPGA